MLLLTVVSSHLDEKLLVPWLPHSPGFSLLYHCFNLYPEVLYGSLWLRGILSPIICQHWPPGPIHPPTKCPASDTQLPQGLGTASGLFDLLLLAASGSLHTPPSPRLPIRYSRPGMNRH